MLYFSDFGCLALDLPASNSVRMKLNVNKKLLPSKISFFGLMSGKFYTLFLQNAQICQNLQRFIRYNLSDIANLSNYVIVLQILDKGV